MINKKRVIILSLFLAGVFGFFNQNKDEVVLMEEMPSKIKVLKKPRDATTPIENLALEEVTLDPKETYEIFSTGEEKGALTVSQDLSGEGELKLYDENSDSFELYEVKISQGELEAKNSKGESFQGRIRKISNILGFKFEGLQLELKGMPRFFVPEGAVNATYENMVAQEINRNNDTEHWQREREEAELMNPTPEENFNPDDTAYEI